MAWDSGTITSASPWAQVSTKLKNLVGGSGVANWSFVENIPAGAGNGNSGNSSFSVDVFKCSGSGTDANDAATDWYFMIEIPVPDGTVSSQTAACEDYEGSTNKRFRRPCPVPSTTVPTGAGYWRTDTLAVYNSVSGINRVWSATLNTSGFSYWIKLTKNQVFYTVKVGAAESSVTAGLLDSMTSVSDPCPLFLAANTSTAFCSFSRLPSVTTGFTSSANGWRLLFDKWTHNNNIQSTNFTSNTSSTDVDLWQGGKIHASRVSVAHAHYTSNPHQVGGIRGLVKADFLIINTGGTVAPGDTMTLGGNTWTVIAATGTFAAGGGYWITRAN